MTLENLFANRLGQRWRQYNKYLRYVFNDHAVITLFILLGAGLFGYRELLAATPVTWWTRGALAGVIGLTLFIFRGTTNFLLAADPVFLLADEAALRRMWRQGLWYSMVVNALVEVVLLLVLWPMMVRLYSENLLILGLITVLVTALKIAWIYLQAHRQLHFPEANGELVNWRGALTAEQAHQNMVLGFFNMFLDVPGMTPATKRRAWLTKLTVKWPGVATKPMTKIMMLTFIRQSQFIGTWFRLTAVGAVLAVLMPDWLGFLVLAMLGYLIILQVLPVVWSHEHLAFDHLYPVKLTDRQHSFHQLMLPWLTISWSLWSILALLFSAAPGETALVVTVLAFFLVLLVFWYADSQIKRHDVK
jgi:ABC-2 type transport system permease protein